MDLFTISYQEYKTFFLILTRVSIILLMFPVFNAKVIPTLSKIGLAFIVTIILFPVIDSKTVLYPDTIFGLARLIAAELIVGMSLGLLVQIFFEGIKMMGQLVGFQTGFAITNIIDPHSGMQVSIFSNMAYLVALIIFLLLNGHHILLSAIKESFELMPIGSLGLNNGLFKEMINVSGDMFIVAIKIGAPAIAALLFTKVAFGLITKLMPQMNIMIVAFPVQIFIGLIFFGISLNLLIGFVERYIEGLNPLLINAMKWLRA